MAQAEVGALRVRLAMDAGEFSSGTKKAGRSMDSLASKAKKVGSAIGAAFAVGQVTSFARESVRLFGVQEDAIASVDAVLKTTGGSAGFTSKKLQEMASSLQEVTTFGDEEILRGATSNLLTFGNIVGPVFERAQKAALDLSQQFNVGLKESSIQLGKALNDPIRGISALSRVGIAFTQQQKDQIKTLVESGRVMEAQAVILDEIDKFYGQAAESAAKTTAGQLTQAANAFGDAMEEIGRVIAPVVVPAANAVKDLSVAFAGLSPQIKTFMVVGAGMTVGIGAAAAAIGAFSLVLGAAAAPIAVAVAGIGALTGAIVAFWPNLKQVAKFASTAFQDIYESAKRWLVDALEPVISRVQAVVDRIRGAFSSLRQALGLDTAAAAIKVQVDNAVQTVQLGVDKISEIWTVAADEGEKIAEDVAPKMVMPMIVTAEQAKASAKVVEDEKNKIIAAQEALISEGVNLSEDLRTPFDVMEQKVRALTAAQEAGKISAIQLGQAQAQAAAIAQNAYAGMASSILGSLEGIFGQSKGFAIAQALINTYEGFTKALAAYPPPWNYAAAAATLAAGMAQVANIRKTTKSGSGGGGSGGAAAGAGATAAAAPQQQQSFNINLQGDTFGRDQVRDLIENINDAISDGAVLRIA